MHNFKGWYHALSKPPSNLGGGVVCSFGETVREGGLLDCCFEGAGSYSLLRFKLSKPRGN